MYLLIKARILKKQGDLQEAINCLKSAMSLPGVRAGGGKHVSITVAMKNHFLLVYVQGDAETEPLFTTVSQ